jgi:iron complex transport system substrate-binding protein
MRVPANRRRRLTLVAAAAAVAVLSTACGGSSDKSATPEGRQEGSAFPVTIKHALGEATIEKAPERVVTWGWAIDDTVIALGVVPVAMPFQVDGGDNGILPWVEERLAADGKTLPPTLPNVEEPPFEAIASARPDLILAVYSGITDTDYQKLSAIAPTVAYPDKPWTTPWRDIVTITGQALGRSEQAEELLRDMDAAIAEAAAAHPELKGKSVAAMADYGGAYVYRPADPRVEFLNDFGLVNAPSVDQLANGGSTFAYPLSYEKLGELKSDILVTYAATQEASQEFLTSPYAKLMDQVNKGAVAAVAGVELRAAINPPTPLSLTWGLDEFVALLSKAAGAAG